jgi:pimeloyl-ACP methyl ester carboxylesterase
MDGTGDLFAPFLRALGDRAEARVVRYPADRTLAYEGLRPFLLRALPRDRPYALVAESFSGPLAIRHAAGRPPGLRALVLVASFARCPLPPPLRWLRAAARAPLFRVPPPAALLRTLLLEPGSPPGLVDSVGAAIRRVRPAVLAARLRQVFEVSAVDALPRIAVPVLHLVGSRDLLVGERGLLPMVGRVPDLSSLVLDGPHLLLQTRATQAADAVLAFPGRVPGPDAVSPRALPPREPR